MLSVIIPTYNGLETLQQSLPTWLAQQMGKDDYEVIVADNRSTDATRGYVGGLIPLHANLKYVYEPQPGATAARHAGARASKGDILVFADNDGLFNPECLQEIKKVYESNPACEAVACKIDILWDAEKPSWIGPYKYLLGQLDYGDEISYSYDYYLNGGLMSVKRDTFERLHGFNPDLIGPYLIGDGDLGLVKKLFKGHCLIGYTPFASMQHMQKVEKHGSVEGIALHFYNNGIAASYGKYREEDFRFNGRIIRYLLLQSAILVKQWVNSRIIYRNNLHRYFTMREHLGAVRFFKLLLNKELRKNIRVRDGY